ncbi:MAG: glutathione S-transferase N-terminal domain-containing protein [Myxococcota bacterium]
MLELHITNKNYSSWSLRPWVLMRELGITFSERLHPLEPVGDWSEVRRLSPAGKVPFLVIDGMVVRDSLAIVETLHERFPGVWPTGPARLRVARSASAEMHSSFGALRSICSMSCGVRIRLHTISSELQRDIDRIANLWLDGLGRFDACTSPAPPSPRSTPSRRWPSASRPTAFELPPAAQEYAARLRAVPSMHIWYEAALVEPWRDEPHDRDTLQSGTLVADHRHPVRT